MQKINRKRYRSYSNGRSQQEDHYNSHLYNNSPLLNKSHLHNNSHVYKKSDLYNKSYINDSYDSENYIYQQNDSNDFNTVEVIEDTTLYGEFVATFDVWMTPEEQRRKARRLEMMADSNNNPVVKNHYR